MQDDDKPGIWVALFAFVITWITLPLYLWVASVVWNWYMVPLHGMPHIGLRIVLCATLVYGLLFRNHHLELLLRKDLQTRSFLIQGSVYRIFLPLWTLLFAWMFRP